MDHKARLKELFERFLQDQCTPAEVEELFSIINKGPVSDELDPFLDDVWAKLETYPSLEGVHSRRLFQKIKAKTAERRPVRKRHKWLVPLRVAAAIALIAAVAGILSIREEAPEKIHFITKATEPGQRASYLLPDGSRVTLNTGSSITFPGRFNEGVRSVKLAGEAFFEVTRDTEHPFIIQSSGIKTSVLGTSFNIRAYQGQNIEVTVATGKVQVESLFKSASGDDQVVVLTPNKQAVYDPAHNSLTQSSVDINKFMAWNAKELILQNTSLVDAIFMLEKRFDQKIILKNREMGDCIIRKARYEKESLETILKGLQLLIDFKYEFNGYNQWTITGKGCE